MWHRFFLSLLFLLLLQIYLFANIKNSMGVGVVSWVLIIAIFVAFVFFSSLFLNFKFYIKKSFLFLLCFFTYFIINILLDFEGFEKLKALTVTTTGGIVFFYFLGFLSKVSVDNIFYLYFRTKKKILFYIFFISGFIFLGLLVGQTLMDLRPNLREDIFLLNNNFSYQRKGDFLTISFIYIMVLYNYFIINEKFKGKNFFILNFSRIIYYFTIVVSIGLSQIIGSNKAFAVLAGIIILSIITDLFNTSKFYRIYMSKILIFNLKSRIFYNIFFKLIFIVIPVTFFLANLVIYFFDFDIKQLRIFRFGQDDNLLESRLFLLANFWNHFNYSPIFGNMNVDDLTTGNGTYVHSFILSLLTHLGLIGFILFFLYLYFALKEFFSIKDINLNFNNLNFIYFSNNKKIFLFFLFSGIFLIASISTFITWSPLWFILGLIFPPIKFKKLNE